jgi:cell wall-associated NlpC family hydrolase
VEAQTKKYTDLLATLNAQQQEQYRDRNAPTAAQLATTQTTQALPAAPAQPAAPPAVGGGSAKAQIAVAYARAQLGKPYVFAAAGPDAFDCSGLTMMAWAAAGVSLPHFAPTQMQYGSTVPIDVSAMLPGDLIFLYPDIGHVEIYAGNGMAISAPQPGDVVKYVSVAYDMPNIVGVRRIA